jgi:hypothetical protein
MNRAQRGTALAETALVVGLALLVIFNALELSLLGFYQLHVDAAAFLTARVFSLADATTAQSTLASALPPALGGVSLTTQSNGSLSVVQQKWDGLLLPGFSNSSLVYGEDVEPTASQATVTSSFAFDVPSTTLPNYYPQGDVDDPSLQYTPAYTGLYIAQNLGSGNGNGWNGQFAEWRAHAQCFAKVNFPNSYAATQSSATGNTYYVDKTSNPWANFPNNSVEDTIYGWDQNPHTGTC